MAIFWFRRDLRLDDNRGLFEALNKHENVLPLFIFDKNILQKFPKRNDFRVSFIYNALKKINSELRKVGRAILTCYGTPKEIFEHLLSKYSITAVYANIDYESTSIQRDAEIEDLLRKKGIKIFLFHDHVVFSPQAIIQDTGKPYQVFTAYRNKWLLKFESVKKQIFPSEKLLHKFYKYSNQPFIDLTELGYNEQPNISVNPIIDTTIIKQYHLYRDYPFADATTKLGIHLRFGTISIRKLSCIASEINPIFLSELIWRNFFMSILYHYPYIEKQCFKKAYEKIHWRNDDNEFKRWCSGETGYPLVDAGMRQLNETGFMHNRVRMVCGSFLTKHLLIDWRWGETYFAEKLNDFELASNNGNWQWVAGTGCDAAPYFRIFNPSEQLKKFDKEKLYINRWIKNLDKSAYPEPIVEHEFARNRCLAAYKKAIQP